MAKLWDREIPAFASRWRRPRKKESGIEGAKRVKEAGPSMYV